MSFLLGGCPLDSTLQHQVWRSLLTSQLRDTFFLLALLVSPALGHSAPLELEPDPQLQPDLQPAGLCCSSSQSLD